MQADLSTRFPFLAGLSAPARQALSGLREKRLRARAAVLQRGDEVEGVYLVLGGSLRVFHLAADGREATLYWVEPGQTCILALTAAFRRERYPAWVETGDEPVSYVLVPDRLFRALLEERAFREFVFEVLSGRVFELMVALEEVGFLRIEQRVARFLLRRADAAGVVRMSQARLAGHLGTAREVVFRALRSLVARGLVESARGRIHVVNRAALAERASPDDDDDERE